VLGVLNLGTDAAIATGEAWPLALVAAERALAAMLALAPPGPVGAVVGLQHLRTAKLAHYTGDLRRALVHFDRAVAILSTTHGVDHGLVGEARGALQEAASELAHG
jgi:hypothetical protein